jgi:hypothetical protein
MRGTENTDFHKIVRHLLVTGVAHFGKLMAKLCTGSKKDVNNK